MQYVIVISLARGFFGIYCTKHEGAQRQSDVGNKSQTNRDSDITILYPGGMETRIATVAVYKAKIILLMSQILSQAIKARLRYKLVDFLGTWKWISKTAYDLHFPFCSTHLAYHKPYLRVRAVLLHSNYTCRASESFLQSGAHEPPKAVRSSV